MSETMKAVQYSSYGGGPSALQGVLVRTCALDFLHRTVHLVEHATIGKSVLVTSYSASTCYQLKDVPVPVPDPKKMLVKVEAASVNPFDWKLQGGSLRPFLPAKFPYIPGTDVAGEVVSVGSEVQDFAPGDKVASWLDVKFGGSLAQYAVASPKYTVKRPPEVSAIEGACLPVAALTALQGLTSGGMNLDGSFSGNVLITAGSGGVGTYAVQIAKLGGAHVTVTSGARNIDLLKELGADEVLDYKTAEGKKLASPSGKKYDIVLNGATGVTFSEIQPQLAPRAVVFELNPGPKTLLTAAVRRLSSSKQRYSNLVLNAESRNLELLVDWVKEGKLRAIIDSKFSLEQAAEAWKKSKEGHAVGKIVVTVSE